MVALVKDAKQDGIIVDARAEQLQIRPHPALDRGVTVVVTATGVEEFDSRRHSDLAETIRALRA